MSGPQVTVVIPTRDRRGRLARTLAAALAQTGVDHEIVIVDDGSVDGTADLVTDHPDPRVRTVRHPMALGLARARNAGVAVARAPYVAFLDDDDLWAPDKLAAQLEALAAAPRAGWCAVGGVIVDDRLRVVGWKRPPPPGDVAPLLATHNPIPGGGSGVLAATDLVREAGGFDPTFTCVEDLDLWIRLAPRSPLATVDRPLVASVLHDTNLSTARPGHDAELQALEDKHRSGPGVSTLRLRATQAAGHGRRGVAARLLLQDARRNRDPRSVLRAAAQMARGGGPARGGAQSVPSAWRRDAEGGLLAAAAWTGGD